MSKCTECGSYAINHHCHGRDGSDPELCDVCYWRRRATETETLRKDAKRYLWILNHYAALHGDRSLAAMALSYGGLDAAIDAAMQESEQ